MTAIDNDILIVKEFHVKNFLTAMLYDNGVIEIVWDKSIKEIEVIHLQKMQEVVCMLGEGMKMPLYFTMHPFLGITREARNFASSQEGVRYTLATTVLIDNLAKKVLFNFFLNVNKPCIPTRGFSRREDCMAWLEKIAAKHYL